MSNLQLHLETNASKFVRTPRGVEERTFPEIFVLRGTTPAEKEIPKAASFRWDGHACHWWTERENDARKLERFAHNGLRERWGLSATGEFHREAKNSAATAGSTSVVGTPQQEAFWRAVVESKAHLVLEARAGSGKSFSIVEAANRARERRIGFSAFNKHIADELTEKIPGHAKAFTLHSLGFSAVRRAFHKVEVDASKAPKIIKELYPDATKLFVSSVAKLCSLCKCYLIDGTDADALEEIATRHDVDCAPAGKSEMGADVYRARVFSAVPRALALMKKRTSTIDMDDMVWLPVVLELGVENFDLLFIDEAQDMNLCQQRLSFMACPVGRVVIVGDPKQAIYAFRGADTRSMARMTEQLSNTARGVVTLPLTFTRRCPKSHVALAQQLVPDIEAMAEAPDGEIENIQMDKIAALALPREMVICRTNAPLIKIAHGLLRVNKKPLVKGRDIGASIRELLKKLEANTMPELAAALTEYSHAESARLAASGKDDALIRLQDRVETLEVLMEGCASIGALQDKMTQLFDAKDDDDSIILSSVHSCKGLEAETVYILRPELMPHPKATRPEDTEQENNIRYVALTRSKNKIVFAHEHYTEPKLATGEQAAGEDPPHALFDEETPDLLEGDVPDHILNPTPYWDQVESDGVTAGREYSPTPGSPNFNAPNFDEDLFSSWKDHVRALLKEAHERTPFDELEVIEKIEAALAAL